MRFEDYIVITIDTAGVAPHLKRLEDMIHINLMMLYREVADSTTKRIRVNVSGAKPYGTGKNGPPIVRRQGRVYDTIGYRSMRTSEGPYVLMGAIKGGSFGRMLAKVHDDGMVITAKKPGGKLIFPPPGSPARDASGEQIMTATQTRRMFYSQWDTENIIWVRRTKQSDPEVAFIKKKSVKIPGRHIISRELAHVRSEIARKVDTTIATSLRLETIRI